MSPNFKNNNNNNNKFNNNKVFLFKIRSKIYLKIFKNNKITLILTNIDINKRFRRKREMARTF